MTLDKDSRFVNEPELTRSPRTERGKEASKRLQSRVAIAKAIIQARLGRNWTQQQLADAASTKQSRISELESIRGNPTIETISRVALALDLELSLTPTGANVVGRKLQQGNCFIAVYYPDASFSKQSGKPIEYILESDQLPVAIADRMRGSAKPSRCA